MGGGGRVWEEQKEWEEGKQEEVEIGRDRGTERTGEKVTGGRGEREKEGEEKKG